VVEPDFRFYLVQVVAYDLGKEGRGGFTQNSKLLKDVDQSVVHAKWQRSRQFLVTNVSLLRQPTAPHYLIQKQDTTC
jgi:hypothetical protein